MARDGDSGSSRDGEPPKEANDDHVLLPREAHARVGQHLRRIYGEILAEPLPDKFTQLLDELAKSERPE